MLLETDLGRLLHAASNRDERGVLKLDLKEEDEILEQVDVLEQKELGIALSEESKIKQPSKSGLAEVMGVFVSVLRQPNFGQNDIQALDELHRLEQVGLV